MSFFYFFFNDTATTEIYTLSLHDALPIYHRPGLDHRERRGCGIHLRVALFALHRAAHALGARRAGGFSGEVGAGDRKSTRLNSSHSQISYAVFCLKKKKNKNNIRINTDTM